MFITYDPSKTEGNVSAYSDKVRNFRDLQEGENQVEIDLEFSHIDCTEGSLNFENGELKNDGVVIANAV